MLISITQTEMRYDYSMNSNDRVLKLYWQQNRARMAKPIAFEIGMVEVENQFSSTSLLMESISST